MGRNCLCCRPDPSLIYVGVQVTDNTSAARSETSSNANSEFIDFYHLVCSDAELAEIWLGGITNPETLTDIEALMYDEEGEANALYTTVESKQGVLDD